MKLVFKKIRLKNFRSVSNHQLELDLNQPNTLITSVDNGSGKCLRGDTNIDIKFNSFEAESKFKEFLASK